MKQSSMSEEQKKEMGFIPWEPYAVDQPLTDPENWFYVEDIAPHFQNWDVDLSITIANLAIQDMIDSVK